MACHDNINGVLRKVDKIYDNVGGVLREVSKGYDNIGGTLQEYHSASMPLSSKAVGSIIKLRESGTLVDYIVVHQGRPSTLYDTSCDGTWLLRKDIFVERQWQSTEVNDYANSEIKAYLDVSFLNRFETAVKNAIKQVKIPYRPGSTGNRIYGGVYGLSCKIFLLSCFETGGAALNRSDIPVDGAKLSYFIADYTATANNKRVAYLNGNATGWWFRSPNTSRSVEAWTAGDNGNHYYLSCLASDGVRPALILPASLLATGDGEITV